MRNFTRRGRPEALNLARFGVGGEGRRRLGLVGEETGAAVGLVRIAYLDAAGFLIITGEAQKLDFRVFAVRRAQRVNVFLGRKLVRQVIVLV